LALSNIRRRHCAKTNRWSRRA